MKYELYKLESFVKKFCNRNVELSPEEYEVLRKIIEEENLRIRDMLINNYFFFKKNHLLKKYISQHQLGIIRLLDIVFSTLNQSELNNINDLRCSQYGVNIKKLLYLKLESLLSFIESYFSTYFNQEDKIPDSYQLIAKYEFKRKLDSQNNFRKQKERCSLISIAANPLEEFIDLENKVSFRQLIYLKKLLSVITKTCNNCHGDNKKCPMKLKLIHLNFNSYRLYSFLTNHIINEYQEQENLNKQIEILCYYLKRINQSQEKPGFVLKKDLKSLKDQLSMWFIEEIAFLEKKKELSQNPYLGIRETLPKDFKITTECSVPQVAYFIRLLVDAGAITNKNQREIISFFANSIKTKKAENISPESFRTKYYNTESSTIEAIKDLIIKMLNKIHKEK